MLCWTYAEKKLGRGHFTRSFANSLESHDHFLESPWLSFEDLSLGNDRFLLYVMTVCHDICTRKCRVELDY